MSKPLEALALAFAVVVIVFGISVLIWGIVEVWNQIL
jgi:hypothetical protein